MDGDGSRDDRDALSHPRHVETLRRTWTEARTVLDHQIAVLNDVDDKAARTVRVAVLVLAAVAGAPSVLDRPERFLNPYTTWGTLSLVLAVVLGVATYSFSTPNFGPSSADLERVLDETYGEVEWFVVLLDSYADWIDRTASVNLFNGMLLAFAQAALGVGVSLLAIGTATRFDAFAVDPLSVTPASAPVQTIALGVVLLLGWSLVRFLSGGGG